MFSRYKTMEEQISIPVKNYARRFREYQPAKHALFPTGVPEEKPQPRKPIRQQLVDHAARDDRLNDLADIKAAVAALEDIVKERPHLDDAQDLYRSLLRAVDLLSKLSADQRMLDDLRAISRFISWVAHGNQHPA